MPAWYNSLPESVKRFESTREAAIISYERTASQDSSISTSYAKATANATTGPATSTASSYSNGAMSFSSAGGAITCIAGGVGAISLGVMFAL